MCVRNESNELKQVHTIRQKLVPESGKQTQRGNSGKNERKDVTAGTHTRTDHIICNSEVRAVRVGMLVMSFPLYKN